VTRQEALAVNVVLDLVFGRDFDPDRFVESAFLLAVKAHQRLGEGWNWERVEEATRRR
jgi:hypothetical protein